MATSECWKVSLRRMFTTGIVLIAGGSFALAQVRNPPQPQPDRGYADRELPAAAPGETDAPAAKAKSPRPAADDEPSAPARAPAGAPPGARETTRRPGTNP